MDNKNIKLLALCLGYFMTLMDITIVNVALPQIAINWHLAINNLQWIVNGYTMTFSCFLLSASSFTKIIGNKNTFITGILVFIFASICCGLSTNINYLIIFRFIQGIGGAILVPSSLTLISMIFTDAKRRASAIALWAATGGLACALGPLIGGVLTSAFGWRTIFLVNIPFGIIVALLSKTIKNDYHRKALQNIKNFDFCGQVLILLSLGGLTYTLIKIGESHTIFHLNITLGIIIFWVATTTLIQIEKRIYLPIIPLQLFKSSQFSTSIFLGLLLNFIFYGALFIFPLYFHAVKHYSTLLTGLAVTPFPSLIAMGNITSGKLSSKYSPRLPLLLGKIFFVIGFCILFLTVWRGSPYLYIMPGLLILGLGVSFIMPAVTLITINSVTEEYIGNASGLLNTSRQVGGMLGIAIFGTILNLTGIRFGTLWCLSLGFAIALLGLFLSYFFIQPPSNILLSSIVHKWLHGNLKEV